MLYLEARCVSRGARGRVAGRAERLDLVRRARALRARRDARDPGRERARRLARPRGRLGQRRDRVALGDPQDGQADGAVPAGHRLRHLRLLGHAAPRQHVRRRELRRRRPRRVADDAARLAGRRRHRAGRGGRGAARARARPRAPCRPSSTSSACRRSPTRRSTAATAGYDSGDLPDRDRAADVEAADALLERRVTGVDVALALDRRGFADVAEAVFAMQRQRVAADYLQTSAVIDAEGLVHSAVNDPERLRRPRHAATGSRASAGSCCRRSRTSSTRAGSAAQPTRPAPVVDELGRGRRRRRPDGGGRRRRAGVRRRDPRDDQRARPRDVLRAVCDGVREGGARHGSCGCAAWRTSRSSPTTAPGCPARASRSACSRRARRSSTAPTCSRSTTSSSSACRRSTRSRATARWAGTRPVTRSASASGPCRRELDNFARAKLIVRTTLLHAQRDASRRRGRARGRARPRGGSGRVGAKACLAPTLLPAPRPARRAAPRARRSRGSVSRAGRRSRTARRPRSRRAACAGARGGASADHGGVRRHRRLDEPCRAARSGGRPRAPGAVLRPAAAGARASRRHGGEVHRRRGRGAVRGSGGARGRSVAGRACRARRDRRDPSAERGGPVPRAERPCRGDDGRGDRGAGRACARGAGMAWGDVLNTAARLQSSAPVDGVLVDERTRRACVGRSRSRRRSPFRRRERRSRCAPGSRCRSTRRAALQRASPLVGREARARAAERALGAQRARSHRAASASSSPRQGSGRAGSSRRWRRRATAQGAAVVSGRLPPVRRGHHVLADRGDGAPGRGILASDDGDGRCREARHVHRQHCRRTISTTSARSPRRSHIWWGRSRRLAAPTRPPRSPRRSCTGACAAPSSSLRADGRSCSSSRTCTGPSRR